MPVTLCELLPSYHSYQSATREPGVYHVPPFRHHLTNSIQASHECDRWQTTPLLPTSVMPVTLYDIYCSSQSAALLTVADHPVWLWHTCPFPSIPPCFSWIWQKIIIYHYAGSSEPITDWIVCHDQLWPKSCQSSCAATICKPYGFISTIIQPCKRIGNIM